MMDKSSMLQNLHTAWQDSQLYITVTFLQRRSLGQSLDKRRDWYIGVRVYVTSNRRFPREVLDYVSTPRGQPLRPILTARLV